MSKKSSRIAALIDGCRGQDLDPHYLGYFECFNRGLYFEAHEVLEELWLPERHQANGNFYRGLIQLAGAFVHLQKNRLRPAASLFNLAETNLKKYPTVHERLEVANVLSLLGKWREKLEATDFAENPLTTSNAPQLSLPGSQTKTNP